MLAKNKLSILTSIILYFLSVVEGNAKIWWERSQENIFITVGPQRKDIFFQKTNGAFIIISGQSAGENGQSITEKKGEKVIFTAIAVFLGGIALKTVAVLKRWVSARFSQAFYNWRDSLYH
ncbi:hypothetical protein [Bartonella sp. ML70XJBT.G]|uniref:hypothetical protein n=1 Tax=Bartonella sp. ML70XJBT.G TaxID=3019093 RepID=UPI00236262B1|nr:hypothetical protein [Bartonella sp. ML70XJBT.G]